MSNLLHNLNEQQLAAVTLPSQHALILAGAGSGKTRVLTTRIAWLIQNGIVSPAGILAVTFTNKAAKEMTARLGAMLPINIRGMWLGTFHGLCNRFLRAHHRDARLPQTFQILDTGDQLAAVKRVMKVLQVDEDKFPPRQVQYFIADAKEKGERAGDIAVVDEISRRYAEIYAAYDEQCQKEGVVDFAELLLRSFELLSRNEILCEHYRNRFRHILVDEFQDTNVLQYRWLKLLSGPGSSIFAVGDDDQCLAEGTKVTMADGRRRAIERVQAGDKVLSAFGSGEFRPATVMRVHRGRAKRGLITLHTRGGKKLSSTPEHTHFAGYRLGETPQTYFVYLMHKAGIGYRLGTSQVYTRGQARPMVGFRQRSLQEHADALWVVGTHASENEARAEEILLSLRYGLPTLPFVPRKGKKAVNGLVHDATFIRRVFDSLDTDKAARALLADRGLSPDEPHHLPQSRDSNRRNISITLCGDRRGLSPMHRIAIVGNDAEGRAALAALGLSVRPAKKGSRSWRFETGRKDFGELMRIAERCRKALGARYVLKANLNGKSLPFIRAASVQPGMAIVDDEGNFDTVSRVERERRGAAVCDLDVFPTHNYIAGGVVTHNSIYRFRGANVGNMADFERDFRVENVIRLEQNYRSQGNILSAANQLITHNRNRLGKNLWTAAGEGEPIRVYEAASDGYEAAWLVEEVQTLVREQGMARRDIAFLYRSNAQSRVLEHALFSAGIPYRVYGGQRFFERMEIKHALAYLRLLANTDDDGAFLRVANFPARGIGARTLEQLQDAAAAAGVSLYLAARQLQGAASLKVGVFLRIIDTLRAETAELPLPEVVEHMLERSGLLAHYRAERDGADRVDNLNELINAAASFEQEEPMVLPPMEEVAPPLPGPAAAQGDGGLFDAPVNAPEQPAAAAGAPGEAQPPTDPLGLFLAHAALESGENQAAEGMDALQMMTVHSAKGLEFHAVFITGLEEGLFPHEQSVMEDDGLEEERRLMYVAITRARTRLYLSFAKTRLLHGQTRYNIASRFLDEVPDELIKWLTPKLGSGIAADPGWLSSPSSSSATAPPKSRDPGHGYRIGQTVSHAKFGQGVIVSAEGTGTDARLQINFGRQGMKWLALEFAKLTPV